MSSPAESKWMASLLQDNFLDDDDPSQSFWCGLNQEAEPSVHYSSSCKKDKDYEKASSKKRLPNELRHGSSTKACREKMRRDKLNERFLELNAIVGSGKTSKTDKTAILADAFCTLNQLKAEAQQLRDCNEQLLKTIKKLRVEKSKLWEEKSRLKKEHEKLEKQLNGVSLPSIYMPPSQMAYAVPMANKASYISRCTGTTPGMWQWMPPGVLDTSQDHVLRPPVA